MNGYMRLVRGAVVVALAFLASATAWWWHVGSFKFATPFAAIFRHLSFLGREGAEFLWFPGWLVIYLIRGYRTATPTTKVLIPILSGLFWSWIGMLILSSIEMIRDRGRWARLTRLKRAESVIILTIVLLVVAGVVCSLLGWWQLIGAMEWPLLLGVPVLILALIFGNFIALLVKFAHWLASKRAAVAR